MSRLLNFNPEWLLRLGLGLTYVYSGQSLIREPSQWVGFIPSWFADAVGRFMAIESYLVFQGLGELLLAFLFLAWFVPRWGIRITSAVAALEFLGILFLAGLDLVTFRDFGLLGSALALVALAWRPTSAQRFAVPVQSAQP